MTYASCSHSAHGYLYKLQQRHVCVLQWLNQADRSSCSFFSLRIILSIFSTRPTIPPVLNTPPRTARGWTGRSLTLLCPAEDAYIPFLANRKVRLSRPPLSVTIIGHLAFVLFAFPPTTTVPLFMFLLFSLFSCPPRTRPKNETDFKGRTSVAPP